jgi:hypothetical protein
MGNVNLECMTLYTLSWISGVELWAQAFRTKILIPNLAVPFAYAVTSFGLSVVIIYVFNA